MIIEQIKKFAANRNSSFPGFYSTLLIGPWGMTINFMLKCYKVLFFFWDTYSFSFQTVQCAWAKEITHPTLLSACVLGQELHK